MFAENVTVFSSWFFAILFVHCNRNAIVLSICLRMAHLCYLFPISMSYECGISRNFFFMAIIVKSLQKCNFFSSSKFISFLRYSSSIKNFNLFKIFISLKIIWYWGPTMIYNCIYWRKCLFTFSVFISKGYGSNSTHRLGSSISLIDSWQEQYSLRYPFLLAVVRCVGMQCPDLFFFILKHSLNFEKNLS